MILRRWTPIWPHSRDFGDQKYYVPIATCSVDFFNSVDVSPNCRDDDDDDYDTQEERLSHPKYQIDE